MSDEPGVSDDRPRFTAVELAAIGDYLPELRRSLANQRILRTSLAIGFVIGLAAHVVGYVVRSSAPAEPLGLFADLLYALGWAMWTGVVVALFVQVFPELKRRQIVQALDAYEASRRAQSSATDE